MNKKEYYEGEFAVNLQLYFCGLPLRLDSYWGCSHLCEYCFARATQLGNISNATKDKNAIQAANPSNFKHNLALAHRWEKRSSAEIEWLRHKVPIHWGGMSDPFQPCENKYKVSLGYMDYLAYYKYPTVISTKAPHMLLKPEYKKYLLEGKFAIQVSLITDNDEILTQLEPGAPSATERMKALEELASLGIWTAVRLQPMIPSSYIEQNAPTFINKLSNIGVKHILAEGLKATKWNLRYNKIWKLFPEAIAEYQHPESKQQAHEIILPTWRKWQYIKELISVCHENNMTYGAADNDLRDMGDTICCCGIDNLEGFSNFWRYQASQAVIIAKSKGHVSLDDMQYLWQGGDKSIAEQEGPLRQYAKNLNTQVTPKMAIDYYWNIGGANSPECIASLTRSQLNSKLIYKYQDPVPLLENRTSKQLSMI